MPQLLLAITSITKHSRRSFSWLTLYLIVGLAVFIVCGTTAIHYQPSIKQAFLDYLFPQSWHSISEYLFEFFFETQAKQVLANLIISGSLVIASIFLFPIKERYSARFETDHGYPVGKPEEFSLWMQGWEETRLFLFYLTAQLVILWIGYYPYQWANITSITLSYFFLFYTFSLDIISPTLQRHRLKYSLINKLMWRSLPLTLTFGLIYSLPALLLSEWLLSQSDLSFTQVSFILFLVNLIFIALAIPAGTIVAFYFMKLSSNTYPVSKLTKITGYSVGFILLVAGLTLHGRLLQSLHHKSQVLKAEYDIDWSSFNAELNSLENLLDGQSLAKLSFAVNVHNPTEYDLVFEDSHLVMEHRDKVISQTSVKGFQVLAGETRQVTMQLDTVSEFKSLTQVTDWQALIQDWRIEMHIELYPDIPFIVEILGE